MPKKTESPLLPLEYCRITRAAQLLNCEVNDILHWGAVGAIRLSVMLDNAPAIMVLSDEDGLIEDNAKYDDMMETLFSQLTQSPNQELLLSKYSRIQPRQGSHTDLVFTYASGLWSLQASVIQKLEQTDTAIDIADEAFLPLSSTNNSIEPSAVLSKHIDNLAMYWEGCISEPEFILVPEQLWITKEDLDVLYKHIQSGEELPHMSLRHAIKPKNQNASISERMAEMHAQNRELILAVAIRAQHRYKNEFIDNATLWAQTIVDHEHTLFKSQKAPLSVDKIAKILAKAMYHGEVDKKS